MLYTHLVTEHPEAATPTLVRPPLRRRFSRLHWLGRRGMRLDLAFNCFVDYPTGLRPWRKFDVFHICDHSYSQLVHHLPAARTGVFCHDLEAFAPLLWPERYRFRPSALTDRLQRRVLTGMQQAAVVFYTTDAIRAQIQHYGLVNPAHLVQAPLGAAPEFTPVGEPPGEADRQLLASVGDWPFLLNVSSNKLRKRLDVLLAVFAAAVRHHPDLRLVRVGPPWEAERRAQIDRLGIGGAIVNLSNISRPLLAELYRRATLVLVTSDFEGFGLPVLEAIACGAATVASDLPALREVGGEAVVFCPPGDIEHWQQMVLHVLADPAALPDRQTRLEQASRFSWSAHTRTVFDAYTRLVS
jgi:glycosyltransferase involved in cell wall biosynthesis